MFTKVRFHLITLLTLTCAGALLFNTPAEAKKKTPQSTTVETETSSSPKEATATPEGNNRFAAYCLAVIAGTIDCKKLCASEGNQKSNCMTGCKQGLSVVKSYCDGMNTTSPGTRKAMSKSCKDTLGTPCGSPCQMRKSASAEAAQAGYAQVIGRDTSFGQFCSDLGSGSKINSWARTHGIDVPSN